MDHVSSLSIARIAVGAGFLAAPELCLKYGLMDPKAPQSPYLGRMIGSREVALGAITLFAKSESKPALVKVGLAVDTADALAGLLAIRSKAFTPARGAVLTGAAVLAIVAGVTGLQQLQQA